MSMELIRTTYPTMPRATRADESTLEGSEIQVWGAADFFRLCHSSLLRSRWHHWDKLVERDGVPLLRDLYGNDLENRLDHSMLLLQQGSDFLCVHQGEKSIETYGKIFRGLLLSTIDGDQKRSFVDLYDRCLGDMRPRYMQFRTEFSARHVRWERVALPVVSDAQRSSRFVMIYSEPLDDKFEILNAAFARSPIGMIAAARAVGNAKTFDDAEVTLINKRARAMLKIPHAGLTLQTIGAVRQWIHEVARWRQVGEQTSSPLAHHSLTFVTPEEKRTTVIVEPIDHFVIYHFVEMG